jgi:gluconokinase
LGAALAGALSFPFIDADDLHPQSNKDKMSQGKPLTDADRAAWLVNVRKVAVDTSHTTLQIKARGARAGVVVACSALKKSYREVLRGERAELDLRKEPKDRVRSEDGGVDLKGEEDQEESVGDHQTVPPQPLSASSPRLVTFFVHPSGPYNVLFGRMTARGSHFMKAGMLRSQFDTLGDPTDTGETGIINVGLEGSLEEQVRAVLEELRAVGATPS